ncbi:MAG: transcriptional regulator, family [Eubacterium sp.]|jgi:putative transcriptional regulator|nr:transcriptional regulator, family [Eubacterium sp.]
MIKYKLSDILIDKNISQNWLSIETGIRPGTINKYTYGTIQRIIPGHLDKICKALNCTISDLIEYVPDKK